MYGREDGEGEREGEGIESKVKGMERKSRGRDDVAAGNKVKKKKVTKKSACSVPDLRARYRGEKRLNHANF